MLAQMRSDWAGLPIVVRVVLVSAVLGVTGYGLVAVHGEPLVGGPDYAFLPAPGQVAVTDPAAVQQLSSAVSTPRGMYTFVDGASYTLVQSLTNNGQVPITVTDTEPSPADWGGLLQVKDSRVAVMSEPGQCCDLNVESTWASNRFQPVTIASGATTYVAVHVLMTHCHLIANIGGGFVSVGALTVDYSVIGFPHSTPIDIRGYWVEGPSSCPN